MSGGRLNLSPWKFLFAEGSFFWGGGGEFVLSPTFCMANSFSSNRSQLKLTRSSLGPRPSLCLTSSLPTILQPASGFVSLQYLSLARVTAFICVLLATSCLSSLGCKLHKRRNLFWVIYHWMPSAQTNVQTQNILNKHINKPTLRKQSLKLRRQNLRLEYRIMQNII